MRSLLSILSLALAASALAAGRPAWATGEIAPSGVSAIASVVAGADADLVVLADGYEHGLRRGMVLTASADGTAKGRLLVAETTANRAVALILELTGPAPFAAGDRVERSLLRL